MRVLTGLALGGIVAMALGCSGGGGGGGGAASCADGGTCPAGTVCDANQVCVPVATGGAGGFGAFGGSGAVAGSGATGGFGAFGGLGGAAGAGATAGTAGTAGGGGTGGGCSDVCASGASQCNGSVIETCNVGGEGCYVWSPSTDCSSLGQACDATGGSAQCALTCTDQCGAGYSKCSGNTVQTCTTGSSGCLEWQNSVTCPTGQVCSQAGTSAQCVSSCTDQCSPAGAQQCSGTTIQTCSFGGNGCLDWVNGTNCASTGQSCTASGGVAKCAVSGEDCSSPIALSLGSNTVNWTASIKNYVPSTVSCTTYGTTGPDVVLSYTADFTGTLDYSISKPSSTRWVALVNGGTCGTGLTSPQDCLSDFSATSMSSTVNVVNGQTYYFYVVDTTSGSNPLSNPLSITLTKGTTTNQTGEDCSTAIPLSKGSNTINWTASVKNYLPTYVSCTSYDTTGPDVVLSYTPTTSGTVSVTLNKPTSTRWVTLIDDSSCGVTSSPLTCISDFSASTMTGSFYGYAGTTYYFYVGDTSSGANPLSNPFTISVN